MGTELQSGSPLSVGTTSPQSPAQQQHVHSNRGARSQRQSPPSPLIPRATRTTAPNSRSAALPHALGTALQAQAAPGPCQRLHEPGRAAPAAPGPRSPSQVAGSAQTYCPKRLGRQGGPCQRSQRRRTARGGTGRGTHPPFPKSGGRVTRAERINPRTHSPEMNAHGQPSASGRRNAAGSQ